MILQDGLRPQARVSARRRGYTSGWERACAQFKREHPLCLGCEAIGRIAPTEVVDHVVPHRGNPVLFWNRANWQPACAWHHSSIKAELERRWTAGKIPASGLQLDSPEAKQLTRARHRPAIGADGFAIAGT